MSLSVAFRADASTQIGTGHVMRCLTLADALKARGAQTVFVSRDLAGHLHDLVVARGHSAVLLPKPTSDAMPPIAPPPHAAWLAVPVAQDIDETAQGLGDARPDWIVVDHYALDATWQRRLRAALPRATRFLVIDDLADRPHDCEILLDTSQPDGDERYRPLVSPACRLLLGPQFALLRPQFSAARSHVQPRSGAIGRILVFYGGSEPRNLTAQTLRAIALVAPQVAVDVVLGRNTSAAQRAQIDQALSLLAHATVHVDVADMAALCAGADLAFGATGVTTWERACLGLPTLAITVAENQRGVAASAVQRGILSWLGDAQDMTVETIAQALRQAWHNPETLAEQSRRAHAWVDGGGVARVGAAMLEST